MLRKKALRKIFTTTLTLFILLTVYLIPKTQDKVLLRTNMEIKNNFNDGTNSIYLLNKDGYLVKTKVFLKETDLKEQVEELLNILTTKSEKITSSLRPIIPENTKVLEISISNNELILNFSKEFLNIKKDLSTQLISSIVYTLTDLNSMYRIKIFVEGNKLDTYPNLDIPLKDSLDKSIGINKTYNISSRDNIEKVVVFYNEKIDNNIYYVPVTKYLNDSRSKIEIIVDELSSSYIYEPNLMSFLNNNIKLLNYEEKENVMFLNFNDYLFNNNKEILEEVAYTISYSVFANYDVNMVCLEVNDKQIKQINIGDIPKK